MPKKKPYTGAKRGAKPKYPWDKWFSQPKTMLVHGKHYNCKTQSMITLIRDQAIERDLRISLEQKEAGKRLLLTVRV